MHRFKAPLAGRRNLLRGEAIFDLGHKQIYAIPWQKSRILTGQVALPPPLYIAPPAAP
jgi:hypothetical protein